MGEEYDRPDWRPAEELPFQFAGGRSVERFELRGIDVAGRSVRTALFVREFEVAIPAFGRSVRTALFTREFEVGMPALARPKPAPV